MEILRMSRLTENLLGAIDYEGCRQKREDNYAVLKQLLPSENPFTRVVPRGPFCYPYYHKKGQELRKRLAEQKIFVPVYWGNVLKEQDPDSLEYQWAADILPLPRDHRYGQEEMEYIAATIKEWERSEMTHKVLILGSLGEFVTLVKKAKEMGYDTVVCDGYENGPARKYADASYVIPVTDIQAVADLCIMEKVDGIITSFSDLLLECMVKIADKAGLPCYLKPYQLPWYRDKSVCRETLKELGLPGPGFAKLPVKLIKEEKFKEIEECISSLRYPLISKPMDRYGSRGIFIIHNREELFQRARASAEFTELSEILVEEYNDGFEFNMMTWVQDGRVHIISIADREKTEFIPGMLPESTRNVYPSCMMDQVEKEALNILQEYAERTGQKEGALSMQFFWQKDRGSRCVKLQPGFLAMSMN